MKPNERYGKQIKSMENIIYDSTFRELPAKEFAKVCAQRLFYFGFGYVADIVADYEEEKKDLQREISELKDEQKLKLEKEYYENIVDKIREIVGRM